MLREKTIRKCPQCKQEKSFIYSWCDSCLDTLEMMIKKDMQSEEFKSRLQSNQERYKSLLQ